MNREDAIRNRSEKQALAQLQRGDIGAYGKEIGVLARYLAGSQWNPSKKRRARF